jgi:hypothetical protein
MVSHLGGSRQGWTGQPGETQEICPKKSQGNGEVFSSGRAWQYELVHRSCFILKAMRACRPSAKRHTFGALGHIRIVAMMSGPEFLNDRDR